MSSQSDWGRFGIASPDSKRYELLGDPTRWGALVNQEIPPIDGVVFPGATITSIQVIQVQCRDSYPRAWTLAGTLKVTPASMWSRADAIQTLNAWAAYATVTMGIGQIQIAHRFNLRAITSADLPYYEPEVGNVVLPNAGLVGVETRPFIIPGALVGGSISITVSQSFFSGLPVLDPTTFQTALIITPFDPGAHK